MDINEIRLNHMKCLQVCEIMKESSATQHILCSVHERVHVWGCVVVCAFKTPALCLLLSQSLTGAHNHETIHVNTVERTPLLTCCYRFTFFITNYCCLWLHALKQRHDLIARPPMHRSQNLPNSAWRCSGACWVIKLLRRRSQWPLEWGTDLMNIIITAVFAVVIGAQSGCTQAADFTRLPMVCDHWK